MKVSGRFSNSVNDLFISYAPSILVSFPLYFLVLLFSFITTINIESKLGPGQRKFVISLSFFFMHMLYLALLFKMKTIWNFEVLYIMLIVLYLKNTRLECYWKQETRWGCQDMLNVKTGMRTQVLEDSYNLRHYHLSRIGTHNSKYLRFKCSHFQ